MRRTVPLWSGWPHTERLTVSALQLSSPRCFRLPGRGPVSRPASTEGSSTGGTEGGDKDNTKTVNFLFRSNLEEPVYIQPCLLVEITLSQLRRINSYPKQRGKPHFYMIYYFLLILFCYAVVLLHLFLPLKPRSFLFIWINLFSSSRLCFSLCLLPGFILTNCLYLFNSHEFVSDSC